MATELEKRMYPFEKREKMRSHPTYKEIEIPWENGLYLTTQKVGSVNYLIKEAHKKAIIKGFDMLSRPNWAKYYLNTGKTRLEKKEEQISDDYYNDCVNNYNIKMSLQAALNIVYMKVVDDTYTDYLRDVNTILNLKQKLPQYNFELADGLNYDNNAIDVFVYLKENIVGGIQILPENIKKQNQKNPKIKTETEQKHDLFEMVYGIKPQIIYASSSGFIKGQLPEF